MSMTTKSSVTTKSFEHEIAECEAWFASPRFNGIVRLHSARQVMEQRGSIPIDYPIARGRQKALRRGCASCSDRRKSITTFGPYSPGQAVAMKRLGTRGSTSAAGRHRPRAA